MGRRGLALKISSFVDEKLLKFILVGIINTIIGAGVMFIMFNVFNFTYWTSSACNYIVGGIVSFFLNKFFTFKNNKKSVAQVIFFILNLAVCYFIAYVLAKYMVYKIFNNFADKIKGNIAMFVGMCLYTVLNYIGQRLFVFTENRSK